MKLRNKIAAITAAAMLAFTGVGFAAWIFTNTVETSDVSVMDKTAVAVEMDETFGLKAYAENTYATEVTKLYLICDAPKTAADYMAGDGVYWAYDAAGEHEITNLYLKGQLNYEALDGVKALSSVTVTFSVSNTIALDKYVTIDSTGTIDGDVVITPVVDGAVVAYTLALPAVSYTSEAISISNVAGVDAMNTYLNAHLTGNLKISAQITAKVEA